MNGYSKTSRVGTVQELPVPRSLVRVPSTATNRDGGEVNSSLGRVETGFEFLQDIKFPLSGLRGDQTKVFDTRLSFGLSPMVEFQKILNYFRVKLD